MQRIGMNWCIACIIATACAETLGNDAAADAKFLESILDEQAIAVLIADIDRMDVATKLNELRKWTKDPELFVDSEQQWTTNASQLKKAGIVQLIIAVSMDDLPNGEPVLVFRTRADGDLASARQAVLALQGAARGRPGFKADDIHEIPSAIIAANPKAFARLKAAKPGARLGLQAALTSMEHAEVRLLLSPSSDARRVLGELAPSLPASFGNTAAVGRGLQWAAIGLELGDGIKARAIVQAMDKDAAEHVRTFLKAAIAMGQQQLASMPEAPKIGELLGSLKPEIEGDRVVLRLDANSAPAMSTLLADGLGQARASALRSQAMNQLKMQALAMHNHHAAYNAFPAQAMASKDARPTLSWRVALLPYLDEQKLYEQFRPDEPWDSEHNRKLLDAMPKVFAHPMSKAARNGKTCYLGVAGANGIVGKDPVKLQAITDGTSQTMMIVEVDDAHAVPWTRPDDFDPGVDQSFAGLGGHFRGIFLTAFADGSVQAFETSMPKKALRAYMSKSGGEVIERR